jgi:hypothetical protein
MGRKLTEQGSREIDAGIGADVPTTSASACGSRPAGGFCRYCALRI